MARGKKEHADHFLFSLGERHGGVSFAAFIEGGESSILPDALLGSARTNMPGSGDDAFGHYPRTDPGFYRMALEFSLDRFFGGCNRLLSGLDHLVGRRASVE